MPENNNNYEIMNEKRQKKKTEEVCNAVNTF